MKKRFRLQWFVWMMLGVLLSTGLVYLGESAFGGSYFDKVLDLVGAGGTNRARDFQLRDVDGRWVKLSDYRGKEPVLLYFWAIWCPACQAVKPKVAELRRKVEEKELAILAINVGSGDSYGRVRRYQKAHPMPFRILYDENSKVSQLYEVRGIPLFVIVDKEGKIIYRDHVLPEDMARYIQ